MPQASPSSPASTGSGSTGSGPTSADLAGHWGLRPGAAAAEPSLVSTRPDLLPRLAPGRPARQMPGLLANLFSLCGQAHHQAARLALQAALGHPAVWRPEERLAHQRATLREHLIRMALDWPRLLPGTPASLAAELATLLRSSPLASPGAEALDADSVARWLQQQLLGQPAAAWLQAHDQAPSTWVRQWAQQSTLPLARLLALNAAACEALATPGLSLDVLADPPLQLPALARALATQPGFVLRPNWQGQHPDTGCGNRRHEPQHRALRSAWDRLVARLVELLRMAQPGGDGWLDAGGLPLGPGEGMAWIEMSRGLLIHRVQLAPEARDDGARVETWQVLAPTEWNAHPEASLAQALRRCAPGDAAAAARLAVAYDPCVPFHCLTDEPPRADHDPQETSPCMN